MTRLGMPGQWLRSDHSLLASLSLPHRNNPVIHCAVADMNRFLWSPVTEAILVREDPCAGPKLGEKLGEELPISLRQKEQGHHSRFVQVRSEEVAFNEAHEICAPRLFRVHGGLADEVRIDFDADASGAEQSGSGNHDPAIT